MQAGSPETIAKETKIPVYSDFRNFDIAKGGKGAPLIPHFHQYLLSEKGTEQLVLNIGGICNGTHLISPKKSSKKKIFAKKENFLTKKNS